MYTDIETFISDIRYVLKYKVCVEAVLSVYHRDMLSKMMFVGIGGKLTLSILSLMF